MGLSRKERRRYGSGVFFAARTRNGQLSFLQWKSVRSPLESGWTPPPRYRSRFRPETSRLPPSKIRISRLVDRSKPRDGREAQGTVRIDVVALTKGFWPKHFIPACAGFCPGGVVGVPHRIQTVSVFSESMHLSNRPVPETGRPPTPNVRWFRISVPELPIEVYNFGPRYEAESGKRRISEKSPRSSPWYCQCRQSSGR